MARPPRQIEPGGTYHVTSRGVERRAVFDDARDRLAFIGLLAKVARRGEWDVLAWCLMGNHYHLLLTVPTGALDRGMQYLNGRHAQDYNRRRRRSGHLWQGRYHAEPVRTEPHLLTAARYVVRNPVRAGLCADPIQWRWSSHRADLGLEPRCLPGGGILAHFAEGDPVTARRRYAAFVAEHDG